MGGWAWWRRERVAGVARAPRCAPNTAPPCPRAAAALGVQLRLLLLQLGGLQRGQPPQRHAQNALRLLLAQTKRRRLQRHRCRRAVGRLADGLRGRVWGVRREGGVGCLLAEVSGCRAPAGRQACAAQAAAHADRTCTTASRSCMAARKPSTRCSRCCALARSCCARRSTTSHLRERCAEGGEAAGASVASPPGAPSAASPRPSPPPLHPPQPPRRPT